MRDEDVRDRPYESTFDRDLREGIAREDAFVHSFLQSKIEHKRDYRCAKSGNLFIEVRYRGRPSGITTSTAHRWAFEYEVNHHLVVPTDRVRELAWDAFKHSPLVAGGDDGASEGVLIRIGAFLPQWGTYHP